MTQIDEMTFRISGMGSAEASGFAEDVVKRISELLPQGASGNIGHLDMTIEADYSISRNSLIEKIAGQVIQKLKLETMF